MEQLQITGKLVDIFNERTYPAMVEVEDGIITRIEELPDAVEGHFILPGFIDSHVHIESSMLVPSEFARLAVVHGTVATVSDPHEIANVCGMKGVEYMIENGKEVPFKFNFGAPSCVPATTFETAGAQLNLKEVEELLQNEEIKYLSEMMNFPGVLFKDDEVMKKIAAAHKVKKPVDGHAPGLKGEQAGQYVAAGISTDHECVTAEEALDKLSYGMKILIREGSAAKNFEALVHLLNDHSDRMMFCTDDKHPDSLVEGHINQLCARAVAKGIDVFKVLRAACINPVQHYKINVGLLRVGDPADFIVAEDLVKFKIVKTCIDGKLVAKNGITKIKHVEASVINQFDCSPKIPSDFAVANNANESGTFWVIEALDGQLITNKLEFPLSVLRNTPDYLQSAIPEDILKIAIVNRYQKDARVQTAWIKNFGLTRGAIASSVAHDSHNIIAVGADDECLCKAVNLVIKELGGVSCVSGEERIVLSLPVAGLMSNRDGYEVAAQYSGLDRMAKSLGSTLSAPFMTLSFMALLVIPHLKISDKGLFDGDEFRFLS
jgi:adenine deaminase